MPFILLPSALPCWVPLAFEFGDFGAAVDLSRELPIAQHLALGDRVVDDVVDGQAGEGEHAVEAGVGGGGLPGGGGDGGGGGGGKGGGGVEERPRGGGFSAPGAFLIRKIKGGVR